MTCITQTLSYLTNNSSSLEISYVCQGQEIGGLRKSFLSNCLWVRVHTDLIHLTVYLELFSFYKYTIFSDLPGFTSVLFLSHKEEKA